MNDVLDGLYESHRLLLVLAALGYFAYWTRTRLWMPRAAHVLAGVGLLVGLGCLVLTPSDAPVNREPLGWVKKGAMLAVFPALVYCCFIFCGGEPAAYAPARACPRCGGAHPAGERCQAE
ncbi:MAG: hypothetical protein U0802_12910 [Candidatus Binatia bacterium]